MLSLLQRKNNPHPKRPHYVEYNEGEAEHIKRATLIRLKMWSRFVHKHSTKNVL